MSWPSATDYNAAVQNPRTCFRDDDLRDGEVVGDLFGLPLPHSGNFADVYQIQSADKRHNWAIKCFTRPVSGLRPRYQAISEHLRQIQRAFMVEFIYLEEGICVRGQWHPIVKMRWVEGLRLNEFLREQLDKPVLLERLAQMWVRLGQELRDAGMAHGDLQHGNVMMVPGSKNSSMALKLIDYDGTYVPALADWPSGEIGHPSYQHPQRLREGTYDRDVDRFSQLLIYTALRSLRIGGTELWQRYDNQENLLFREEDFRQPSYSRLLRELWKIKDRDVHSLVARLLLASQGPIAEVPALDELVDESGVRPLTDHEEAQVNALFDEAALKGRRSRLVVPTPAAMPEPAAVSSATTVPMPAFRVVELPDTQTLTLEPTPPSLPRLPTPPPIPKVPPRSTAEIDLDASPPVLTKTKLEAARLLDVAVAVLSRPAWLAALGAVALLSFLVVNVLVWSSVKQPSPMVRASARPSLLDLPAIEIKEGHREEIPLRIERHDCKEPLILRVDGLPEQMSAPPLTLAGEREIALLPLLAPLGFTTPPCDVGVSLWRGVEKIEEKHFLLSIRIVPRPLLRQPDNIRCMAGDSKIFAFPVERNGCAEPLLLQFKGLPPEVRQESLPPVDGDSPRVKLTIADNLQPQPIPVNLVLLVGDARADTKALLLNVAAKEAKPLSKDEMKVCFRKDALPEALSVKAGERCDLPIALERAERGTDVEIRLEGLPTGVTALPVVIPHGQAAGNVVVETAAAVDRGRYPVRVTLRVEDKTVDSLGVDLVVQKPRGRREQVTFETVDHVKLSGTLYHGWRGKQGACVMLLHDLQQNSDTPGWRHLAETLQAEGHTVLAFDFRGHGESKKVTAKFWGYPVNRFLPDFQSGKSLNKQVSILDKDRLPSSYYPWLIHDIAAASTYLDLRHDEPNGPVNSFNLVVIGAGQSSALGSLWLASEGVRACVTESKGKVATMKPEKLSVTQAVWIGLDTQLHPWPFRVDNWVSWAHRKPVVPVTFVYGKNNQARSDLLRELIRAGLGKGEAVPNTDLTGQQMLDNDEEAAKYVERYLVKTIEKLPPQTWLPRHLKSLRSYWSIPVVDSSGQEHPRLFVAKRAGETVLLPVPLDHFGIQIRGLSERVGIAPEDLER